jgi:hypothetical protein
MRPHEQALSDRCDQGGVYKTYNAGATDRLGTAIRCPSPHLSDPTKELSDQEYSATRIGPTVKKRQTVFYVNDNPRALRVLTSVLEGCGNKMVIACNASKALQQIERNAFA